MDAELLRLLSEKEAAFADEIDVPGACGVDTCSEGGSTLDVADTLGSILRKLVGVNFVY
jgi:hypothetical protein